MAAMQNKQNVNKNNVEYILRLHLVKVTKCKRGDIIGLMTTGSHYNDYRSTADTFSIR